MKNFFSLFFLLLFAFTSKAFSVSPDTTACAALTSISVGFVYFEFDGSNQSLNTITPVSFNINGQKGVFQKFNIEVRNVFGTWIPAATFYSDSDTLIKLKNVFSCQNSYFVRARKECSKTQFSDWKTVEYFYKECSFQCVKLGQVYNYPGSYYCTLSWNFTGAKNYLVEYKLASDVSNKWTRDSTAYTSIYVKNLTPNTDYVSRVISFCGNQFDTSQIATFKTLCQTPSSFEAKVSQDTVVTFKWKNADGIGKDTKIHVASIIGDFRETFPVSDSTFILKNLPKCYEYAATISTICADNTESSSEEIRFIINGCKTCNKPTQINFGLALDKSAIEGSWIGDGVKKYIVEYKLAVDSVKTWTKDSTYYTIIKLAKIDNSDYNTYVARLITACNNKFDTSAIVKFSTLCPQPQSLIASVSSDTIVTFKWINTSTTTNSFKLTVASSDGTTFSKVFDVSGSSFTIKNLPKCGNYYASIQSQCDSSTQSISSNFTQFKLNGCSNCKITTLSISIQNSTTVSCYWNDIGDGKYILEHKVDKASVTVWTKDTVASILSLPIKVTGLDSTQNYLFRVLALCNNRYDTSAITKVNLSCKTPDNLSFSISSDSIVAFSWVNPPNYTGGLTLNILIPSKAQKKQYAVTGNTFTLRDLHLCDFYIAFIVPTACNPENVTYPTGVTQFSLEGCSLVKCAKPQISNVNILVSNRYDGNMGSVGVVGVNTYADKYYFEYKVDDPSITKWQKDSATESRLIINGLEPSQKFLIRIISLCNNKLDTSAIYKFTTDCYQPYFTSYDINLTNDTTVVFKWNSANSKIKEYALKFVSDDYSIVRTYIVSDTIAIISDLPRCRTYYASLSSICNSGVRSLISASSYFKIGGCTSCKTNIQFFSHSDLYATSGILSWKDIGSTKYIVEYKLDDATIKNWSKDSSGIANLNLKNLEPYSNYLARVLVFCFNKYDTSAVFKFNSGCPKVSNFIATVDNDTVVTFKWQSYTNSNIKFQIKVFDRNGNLEKTYNTTGNSFKATDIAKCDYHRATILALCDLTESAPSEITYFTTYGCTNCAKIGTPTIFSGSAPFTVAWNAVNDIGRYYVEYKPDIATEKVWHRDTVNQTTLTLFGLTTPGDYLLRIISSCNYKNDTSVVIKFSIQCPSPYDLSIKQNSDSTVTASWRNPDGGANSFLLKVVGASSGFNKTYSVSGSSFTIKDSLPCDYFDVSLVSVCNASFTNVQGASTNFTKVNCSACKRVTQPSFYSSDLNTISGFWNSAGSDPGVRNYIILYKPSTSNIWFSDSTKNNFISITKIIPNCTIYDFRVVSICNKPLQGYYYVYDTSAVVKVFVPCIEACTGPYGVRSKISDTLTILNWWKSGKRDCILEYSTDNFSSANYKRFTVLDTFFLFEHQPTCTNYQVRLRSTCDSISPSWLYYNFKTTGTCATPTTCVAVQNISYTSSNDTTTITWNKYATTLTASPKFEIQYRLSSDTVWSLSLQTTNESIFLKGLAYCKDYTARIRAVCNATSLSAWTEYKFKSGNNCFRLNGGSTNLKGNSVGGVLVSPNPGSTSANVQFQLLQAGNISIKVLNAIGSEVINIPLGNLDFGVYNHNIENVSALATGLYLISVQAEGDVPISTRWIKL